MADHAAAGDGIISFKMTVIIPGQGSDPVPRLAAEPVQSIRQLPGPPKSIGEGIAMEWIVMSYRNDFDLWVMFFPEFGNRFKQQRLLHHQSG